MIRKVRCALILIVAVLVSFALPPAAASGGPIVNVETGAVRGSADGGVES
jgi:hypothetical protein